MQTDYLIRVIEEAGRALRALRDQVPTRCWILAESLYLTGLGAHRESPD